MTERKSDRREPISGAAPGESPVHSPRVSPRIVMVDDESTNLQIVRIILSRENLDSDLQLFNRGREALEYLKNHQADLILLDLAMPEMDGFEVIRQLRENAFTQETPVIFLSAFQDTEYILKAFELGATDFLSKPIISHVLTARIESVLQTQALKNQLQQSNQLLTDANRLKDELLSIVSHDLRSPLSAIELLCQFLQDAEAGRTDHSREELIHRILNQSRLSRRLVENLLNLNRVEEGHLTPNAGFFLLDELLENCVEDEEPILAASQIEFEREQAEENLICFGDRELLAQVVRNVIGNAIKYAENKVILKSELLDYFENTGGRILLSITDDGEGIPDEQKEMIFEKYGKGDRKTGGSGLGLYIARRIVDLSGGEISVNSELNSHTTFNIQLPNVFKQDHLPQLSAIATHPVAVLSGSRAEAELIEGLLVEGGMVRVEAIVLNEGERYEPKDALPRFIILDTQSSGQDWYQCLKSAVDENDGIELIVYGDEGLARQLEERFKIRAHFLANPLNPLVLFKFLLGEPGVEPREDKAQGLA